MIGYDGEFDSVTRVQAVAAALHFRHMEEEFLAFIDFVIQEAKLTFDGIDHGTFLLANSSDLKLICS